MSFFVFPIPTYNYIINWQKPRSNFKIQTGDIIMYGAKLLFLGFLCACDYFCPAPGGRHFLFKVDGRGLPMAGFRRTCLYSAHQPAFVPWLACSSMLDCLPTVDSDPLVLLPAHPAARLCYLRLRLVFFLSCSLNKLLIDSPVCCLLLDYLNPIVTHIRWWEGLLSLK